jgi:hypothetical protein
MTRNEAVVVSMAVILTAMLGRMGWIDFSGLGRGAVVIGACLLALSALVLVVFVLPVAVAHLLIQGFGAVTGWGRRNDGTPPLPRPGAHEPFGPPPPRDAAFTPECH